MASRLRKIFSRKKDKPQQNNDNERSNSPSLSSRANNDRPTFRTSLYDTASAAPAPETGSYPIKGDHNTPALAGRRGSSRNRRYNPHSKSDIPLPPLPPAQQQTDPRPTNMNPSTNPRGLRMVQDDSDLSDNLSNLRLNDSGGTRGSMPPQASSQVPTSSQGARYRDDVADRNAGGITAADLRSPQYSYMSAVYGENVADRNIADNNRANRPSGQYPSPEYIAKRDRALSQGRDQVPATGTDAYRGARSPDMSGTGHASPGRPVQDGVSPVRRRSIPRKQVGSGISTPMPQQSPNLRTSPASSPHVRQTSLVDKPLPSPPGATSMDPGYGRGVDRPAQPNFSGQRMMVEGANERPSLEGIVDLSNTKDTEVIETIAPAVTHETVHKKVHHVREEVITRDIHTHDVFHRIQPIIDVEVLPARHFLPVEGGGLVEINAEDVPGRRNNWVIAETASKIPSDEAAPAKVTRFTAREFPGTEGDAKRYITPEGIERTEETWVHPPELETGGMLTGQTWPMPFTGSQSATPDIRSTGNSVVSGANPAQPVGPHSDSRVASMAQNTGRQNQTTGSRAGAYETGSVNMPRNAAISGQPIGSQRAGADTRSADMPRNTGYPNQPVGSQFGMRSASIDQNARGQGRPVGNFSEQERERQAGNSRYQAP